MEHRPQLNAQTCLITRLPTAPRPVSMSEFLARSHTHHGRLSPAGVSLRKLRPVLARSGRVGGNISHAEKFDVRVRAMQPTISSVAGQAAFFFLHSPHFPRTHVGIMGFVPLIGHRLAYFQCWSPQSPAGRPPLRPPGHPDTLRNGGKGPASRVGELLRGFARSRWLPRLTAQ